jgi:hypothetical protein
MRTLQRLAFAIGITAMFCGVAAIAADTIPLAPKCHAGNNGRGKGRQCEPLCFNPCEQVVCDPGGVCRWHCEPIPGCVPPG